MSSGEHGGAHCPDPGRPLHSARQLNHSLNLDQLSEKTSICLVNDLCRRYKLRSEYVLTDVSGPEHAKKFIVYLKIGESEKYTGEGSSIKNAQRNAALNALQSSKLKFLQGNKSATKVAPQKQKYSVQTPASELNTLLMKRGIEPIYEFSVEEPQEEAVTVTELAPVNANNEPQMVPLVPSNPVMVTNFTYTPLESHMLIPAQSIVYSPVCYIPQPYPSSYYPHSYVCNQMVYPPDPNTQFYYVYETYNDGTIANATYYPTTQDFSKPCNTRYKTKKGPSKKSTNYLASVQFDEMKFYGSGHTLQEARHAAAKEALKFIKNEPKIAARSESEEKSQSVVAEKPGKDELKGEISMVYEIAARRRLKVTFEVVDTLGKSHMPTHVVRCSLFTFNSSEPYLVADGEHRTKKSAKRLAAQKMLILMESPKPEAKSKIATRALSGDLNEAEECTSNLLVEARESDSGVNSCKSEEETEEELEADMARAVLLDCISSRAVNMLYNLSRQMSLRKPSFHYTEIPEMHDLAKRYQKMTNLTPSSIFCIECVTFFDQSLPASMHGSIRTFGIAVNQRLAKQVATVINLLKMGFNPPFSDTADHLFINSLKFSLEKNPTLSQELRDKILCLERGQNMNFFPESMLVVNEDDGSEPDEDAFEENYSLVLFILREFYLNALKDPDMSVNKINNKIGSLLLKFYSGQKEEFIYLKYERIMSLLTKLNLDKFEDHLQLISSVLALNQSSALADSLIHFRTYICHSDSPKRTIIALMTINLGEWMMNQSLIKNSFVAFGMGESPESAKEMASLWTLRHLAYNALKDKIERQFEAKLFEDQASIDSALDQSASDSSPPDKKNKPSKNQLVQKHCLSHLFDVCFDLIIRKPEFQYTLMEGGELVKCVLVIYQESPKLEVKFTIKTIGKTKRIGRTIAAYMLLRLMGSSHHVLASFEDVLQLSEFEQSLEQSIKNNSGLDVSLFGDSSPPIEPFLPELTEFQLRELHQNIDFLENILKDIYHSFLKNHKMRDPSGLLVKLKERLFEYYNHQQQVLDSSDQFDTCSEHIHQSIEEMLNKCDGTQFWDHLCLLATIASTLTYDLRQPLQPPVLSFRCQFLPSSLLSSEAELPTVAIISVYSSWSSVLADHHFWHKTYLSYGIGSDEQAARQLASYKALRYLAINQWKSNL